MVCIEDAIIADNPQVLHLGLSDQHSVEGIAMLSRKSARQHSVIERNGQSITSKLGQVTIKIPDEFFAGRKLPPPNLRGYFPG
jgi:hypothetical protein